MRGKRGIHIVELLIIAVILGILASLALPRLTQSSQNTRINTCRTNIDIINSRLEMYAAEHDGAYPSNLEQITNSKIYFPEGPLHCPFTDANYPGTLVDNRVDDTAHRH